jgi:signal peptidase
VTGPRPFSETQDQRVKGGAVRTTSRLVRALASIAVWTIASVCFGLLVFVGIGPHTGRYRTLTVLSGSMQPGIPVGAVVAVTPERPSQLRVGQVVTYRIPVEDHRVVTHRVVRVVHGGDRPVFQTRGDANNAPDQWLAEINGDTVWRVRQVVPHLGLVLNWLRQPMVHLVAMVVSPAMLAVACILGIWRNEPTPGDDRRRTATGARTAPMEGAA